MVFKQFSCRCPEAFVLFAELWSCLEHKLILHVYCSMNVAPPELGIVVIQVGQVLNVKYTIDDTRHFYMSVEPLRL